MRRIAVVALLALPMSVSLCLAGPIGDYYLTGCYGGNCTNNAVMFRVHGNQVTNWASHNQGSGDIAIAINEGVVKTVSYYSLEPWTPHEYGAGYDFGGGYIPGSQYFYDMDGDNGRSMLDGTSDGTFNYGMNLDYSELWKFGKDWGDGTPMWSLIGTYGGYQFTGATIDRAVANRIWVARKPYSEQTWQIQRRALNTGALISSFTIPFVGAGLAADDDGSLWVANNSTPGWLYHYTTAGAEIVADRMQFCPNCTDLNIYGGEIGSANDVAAWMAQQEPPAGIPEPGTLWLLALGLLALRRLTRT